MKYVDEYRDPQLAHSLVAQIREVLATIPDARKPLQIMEVCGGHTHTLFKYGIDQLLPDGVEFVHGPGCPVCVLPRSRLEQVIAIAQRPEVILCSFGDALRVPGVNGSLLDARAGGADVRIVYSPLDALQLAAAHPERQVVFFAIGFETTMPATAMTVLNASQRNISNFSLFCQHITIMPTLRTLLEQDDVRIDGFLLPGHLSMVIGECPYQPLADEYAKPSVITGYEPLDMLQALQMLLQQLRAGRCQIENQYTRVVAREGNRNALAAMAKVFETRNDCEWRGLGVIEGSGIRLRSEYAAFDAERRFATATTHPQDPPESRCGDVLSGRCRPTDCPLFGRACTPEQAVGALMVSSEGACAAYYQYRRHDPFAGSEPCPDIAGEVGK